MRVQVDPALLNMASEVREHSKQADKAMKSSLDVITKGIQPGLSRDLMALTPGRVKRPIRWTSERQRRAYFATNGFGAGIPYKRKSGRASLMGKWRIRKLVTRRGNLITATNESPVYKFVVEDPDEVNAWQQFHRNTGWPPALKVAEVFVVYSDIASQRIGDNWFQYWDGVFE